MKTRALANFLLFSIILLTPLSATDGNKGRTCRFEENTGRVFYIREDEEFILESESELFYARPVLCEYSNFRADRNELKSSIDYTLESIGHGRINLRELLKEKYTGTHIFILGKVKQGNVNSRFLLNEYKNSAVQVTVRPDDTYTGYLSELFNTPFIWLPRIIEGMHQTDAGVGSDCISFVIYGMRRMNRNIPYIYPSRIYKYTENISREFYYEKDGIYHDKNGTMVSLKNIRRGDLIYFVAHIAVFYEDRGIPGVLDKDDMVIHSIKTGAHISTIENSEYYDRPVQVLRWK